MKSGLNTLLLGTVTLLYCNTDYAYAADNHFTPHYLVAGERYAPQASRLPAEEKLRLYEYLNYEEREPCQNYREKPQSFIDNGCSMKATIQPLPARIIKETRVEKTTIKLRPIIAEYKVYFDFDRFNIRDSEKPTLERVAAEISKYEPLEVTIAGYTDRSGTDEYNIALSRKRAEAISWALTEMGIPNRILDQEAHGEADPAIPTPDGVRLEENRRVEIQFRK
jgi:OmpA-OmpF porin, OOP family